MCTSSLVFGARLSVLWIDLLWLRVRRRHPVPPPVMILFYFFPPSFRLLINSLLLEIPFQKNKTKKSAFKSISLLIEQTDAFPIRPWHNCQSGNYIKPLKNNRRLRVVCLSAVYLSGVSYIIIMNIMWWNLLTLFAHFHEKCDFQFVFPLENFVFDFWITSRFWRYGFLSNPYDDFLISLRLNGNPNNSRRESFEQQ